MPADIRTFDFNLLKALDALLDERSVTGAAERLSLTQPAVSGILTRLREHFDDPLFVRAQRGMVPTSRALELAGPVKQLLAEVESMLRPQGFEPSSASLTLTIAATDYALRAVMVPFLSALRKQAPGIRVAVVPVADSLHTQLERGDVDLALITPETSAPDLHTQLLFDERYVCVLRAGHPDAAAPLSLDRFCALDHALVSYSGSPFAGATDKALAAMGRQRRVTLSVTSFLVLQDFLRVSDMVAVVPHKLAMVTDGLALLEPPLAIPGFTKIAAWHERTHRDPGCAWARALLFATCESLI
ncbi:MULTISPECIES: LysR family transcriptional regulator [unclassified Duganella]|uniref:LysR family transcriptional regulator n=1 Tax=unclassified Duganella TaxID=2636909 RepID=UPI0008926A0C|nr:MULTISPECIES: LysR family transcriptional regulator [unclassified Duganella]SDG34769.1 transcriptional regulator, LysR family [Duganella sp. OV458]SDJ68421.1 transcriptional regulator, LysR family [Duganella sp. OV510]